ncbi:MULTISPECIES: BTAD domain-containing putative transcriptional regulator [Saccharothrix]|uniref:BTAD domain-containing putative transcriptional regulator n=1 Tax=Saccharothrix TaxID=2071 RepID=UPI0009394AE1|nr:BTAD domain-containing putative transcriptional regulator [Saccharothrix sp. CB00851]
MATSQLMRALWRSENLPSSARKILQNAVWALRHGVLDESSGSDRSAALLTQKPGYLLRVDPDQVDLHRFTSEVDRGRSLLASGSPEEAAAVLGEALALWRGPALADLVEIGVNWPELTAVQNARLDATEDYFEAELACGRHQAVLCDLETLVEAEPLRERLCGQLMLALYRSGRQADALHAYARARAVMVDQFGLEPGSALQKLQHEILNHDPALAAPTAPRPVVAALRPADLRLAETVDLGCVPDLAPPAEREPVLPVVPRQRSVTADRRHVSVLLVRAVLDPDGDDLEPTEVDRALVTATAAIREEAAAFDGKVAASIGSLSLVVFGVPERREDDATSAVRAALRIRERLGAATGHGRRLTLQLAVATGNAVVRYEPGRDDSVRTVTGGLLEECEYLLFDTPAGGIRVCDETHRAAASAIAFGRANDERGWLVTGEWPDRATVPAEAPVARERELQTLYGLLEWVRHRAEPRLVTVLGEAGVGKTRLITEFRRRFTAQPELVRFLVARTPPLARDSVAAVQASLLSSYCGIRRDDSTAVAQAKLGKTVSRLAMAGEEREWLLAELGLLLDRESGPVCGPGTRAAWRRLLEAVATRRPLVLVIDDLHLGEDALLDFVEELADPSWSVPLLVLVTARPELPQRRPAWGGGERHGVTITLDLLSDGTIDHLLDSLLANMDGQFRDIVDGLFSALPATLREEPTVRRRYVRWLLASGCTAGDSGESGESCEDEAALGYDGSASSASSVSTGG